MILQPLFDSAALVSGHHDDEDQSILGSCNTDAFFGHHICEPEHVISSDGGFVRVREPSPACKSSVPSYRQSRPNGKRAKESVPLGFKANSRHMLGLCLLPFLQLLEGWCLAAGEGDKLLLRGALRMLGLPRAAGRVKRAIQFGTRLGKLANVQAFGSNRGGNARHAGALKLSQIAAASLADD